MNRKIIAIGGGENGTLKSNGIHTPYETKKNDIVNITGKKSPNFLFLGHSQNDISSEESYFQVMQNITEKLCMVFLPVQIVGLKHVALIH